MPLSDPHSSEDRMPFNVGPLELVIVLVIALLVIGPKRLPEMGNSLGKTIREFRKASTDITEAASLEPETKPTVQQATASPAAAPASTAPAAAHAPTPAGAPAPAETAEAETPARRTSDDA
jgi:TatA/E family protein of Tat protein translocase